MDQPAAFMRRRPLPRRRPHVLLALGFQSHDREMGIIRYAREAGWLVDARLLAYHAAGQERRHLDASRYDGVLALLSLAAPWLVPLVRKLRLPVVDMWADYPRDRYPRVLLDHAAAGRLGAEHLLERGFRHLLFYTHAIEGKSSLQRGEGFRKTAVERGATFHELRWDDRSPPRGVKGRIDWLTRWLTHASLPLGVMGVNDHVALEVLEAAELAGLQVPRDVAVLGVDNDPLVTELARVPLSSIDSARERAGYEAAAVLDRLMRGERAPKLTLIPPGQVIVRRSTDYVAVADREVAAAIQFIGDHFRQPITVNDVASDLALSRRQLQDRFRAATGQTITQTITSGRVEHAKTLLVTTRNKMEIIAEQSGFSSGERMSKVFRRVVGMTPHEYREACGSPAITRARAAPRRQS